MSVIPELGEEARGQKLRVILGDLSSLRHVYTLSPQSGRGI